MPFLVDERVEQVCSTPSTLSPETKSSEGLHLLPNLLNACDMHSGTKLTLNALSVSGSGAR